ncbi:hypothetical protein ACWET9_45395 [Streptomyces sp. NPDC004059]
MFREIIAWLGLAWLRHSTRPSLTTPWPGGTPPGGRPDPWTCRLAAGPVDAPTDLHPGDLLAFAGDAPHIYRTGPEPADVTVVIASPIIS